MDAKLQSTRVTSQWLQERLVELKRQVADADRALEDFKAANNLKTGPGGQNAEFRTNLNTRADQRANRDRRGQEPARSHSERQLAQITSMVGADALNNPRQGGMTSPGELSP